MFEGLYIAKNKSLCEALLSTNDFYDPRDFGFTDHEVKKILDDYGLTSHLKEILAVIWDIRCRRTGHLINFVS